ncbi:hypothetical protein EVAR_86377_1 [Eumeta japonica]|uniref:Uncharacterized protein n=1 Tax=Eumeta variegata TaxID=151549 RepID=A0A4C1W999_EUMVA|nr:hypothetical protein EVAR_86377_1 [Eumeta japonica]
MPMVKITPSGSRTTRLPSEPPPPSIAACDYGARSIMVVHCSTGYIIGTERDNNTTEVLSVASQAIVDTVWVYRVTIDTSEIFNGLRIAAAIVSSSGVVPVLVIAKLTGGRYFMTSAGFGFA